MSTEPSHAETSLDSVLKERGSKYGPFRSQGLIAQNLKVYIRLSGGWHRLDPDMHEALDMIEHKIARILNGDPNYIDSWQDIAGYAQLVINRLKEEQSGPV